MAPACELLDRPERDRIVETGPRRASAGGRCAGDPLLYDATMRHRVLERRSRSSRRVLDAGPALPRARFDLVVAYGNRSGCVTRWPCTSACARGVTVPPTPAWARRRPTSTSRTPRRRGTCTSRWSTRIRGTAEVRFEALSGALLRVGRARALRPSLRGDRRARPRTVAPSFGVPRHRCHHREPVEGDDGRGGRARPLLRGSAGGGLGPAVTACGEGLRPRDGSRRIWRAWPGHAAGHAARSSCSSRGCGRSLTDIGIKVESELRSLLALRRYPEAGFTMRSSTASIPRARVVENLKREWDVHRMWEWITRVEPNYGSRADGARRGARDHDTPVVTASRGTTGVSPAPIATRTATSPRKAERRPNARRTGLEYRGPSLRAFAELTYNESTRGWPRGAGGDGWTPTDQSEPARSGRSSLDTSDA